MKINLRRGRESGREGSVYLSKGDWEVRRALPKRRGGRGGFPRGRESYIGKWRPIEKGRKQEFQVFYFRFDWF